MKKRGYFFIVDVVIALLILTIGITLVLSFRAVEPPKVQTQIYSEDIMRSFVTLKIIDINDDYAGVNGELVNDGNITNIYNTIYEQIGEFYYRAETKNCDFCMSLASNFTEKISRNLIPSQFNYEFILNNITIYMKNTTSKESTRLLIPSKKMVHGLYNRSEIFGPYIGEVFVWQ